VQKLLGNPLKLSDIAYNRIDLIILGIFIYYRYRTDASPLTF